MAKRPSLRWDRRRDASVRPPFARACRCSPAEGSPPLSAYRRLSQLLALATVGLGAALIVVTLLHGGGVGLVLGALFVVAGGGRLYLQRNR